MTAKEMFEKLGYEYRKYYHNIIYKYKHKIKEIWFHEIDKVFTIFGSCTINNEELQAINKQVEELGWNNE